MYQTVKPCSHRQEYQYEYMYPFMGSSNHKFFYVFQWQPFTLIQIRATCTINDMQITLI